ncbi:MAG: flagellar export chaperone FliS [Oryzihumus sp.]
MTYAAAARARYAQESVGTASPARLVTMLYDRLVRDLGAAELALAVPDLESAHHQLIHAQDIVRELAAGLDLSLWPEGEGLASLYDWLVKRLTEANLRKDAAVVAECRGIVEPLREAWHDAAAAQVPVLPQAAHA